MRPRAKGPLILIVDDEPRYVQLITMNLRASGYQTISASDGSTAIARAEHERPALVILDVMLPDMDGYQVCETLRSFTDAPVIMLTAKAEVAHKVAGLGAGADDYVTKPFSADELIARVQAHLRRMDASLERRPRIHEADGLRVDFDSHVVTREGAEIPLTALEFRLLKRLIASAGRVLLTNELLGSVWGPGYESADEVLRTAVARLRRKIERDPDQPRLLQTVRGVGYRYLAG